MTTVSLKVFIGGEDDGRFIFRTDIQASEINGGVGCSVSL
jgi:hypothetical protein